MKKGPRIKLKARAVIAAIAALAVIAWKIFAKGNISTKYG
jgi:cytosine/uracil/thiamine/allantoin permease